MRFYSEIKNKNNFQNKVRTFGRIHFSHKKKYIQGDSKVFIRTLKGDSVNHQFLYREPE